MSQNVNRRRFLGCSFAVACGAAAGLSLEEKMLLARQRRLQAGEAASVEPKPGKLPTGKIRHVTMSRLILGGNLIGGVAHARDLRYVSPLVRHYFTDEKILETWQLAERHGINTMSAWPSPRTLGLLKRYRQERGGKIQWLGHTNCAKGYPGIKSCIDNGAVGIYIAGDHTDAYVLGGRLEQLGTAIDLIKRNGLVAGVAGHPVAVPRECERGGVDVDFYMKTLHSGHYWSATPPEKRKYDVRVADPTFDVSDHTSGYYHDNIWCIRPEETIGLMKTIDKPWMAFKVLAAGAIHPRQGFAFRNGADFAHVGMFDFQIAEDCQIANRVLSGNLRRDRPWRA